jgi:hypothetical protein
MTLCLRNGDRHLLLEGASEATTTTIPFHQECVDHFALKSQLCQTPALPDNSPPHRVQSSR